MTINNLHYFLPLQCKFMTKYDEKITPNRTISQKPLSKQLKHCHIFSRLIYKVFII